MLLSDRGQLFQVGKLVLLKMFGSIISHDTLENS